MKLIPFENLKWIKTDASLPKNGDFVFMKENKPKDGNFYSMFYHETTSRSYFKTNVESWAIGLEDEE